MKTNEESLGTEGQTDNTEPLMNTESEAQATSDAPVNEQGKMDEELKMANDKFLRLYSEFENYKKRVSKDRIEMSKFAGSDILLTMLPVLDDFERALQSMNEAGRTDAITEGIQLIYTKFKAALLQRGLQEMKSAGEIFDSELHDAVTTAPAPSEDLKGKVLQELEKGYFLNGKVIRYAKVIVGS